MANLRLTYSPVAMGFHWLIAALIIVNFGLAWAFNGHALFWDWGEMHGAAKLSLTQWHKTIGITVLVLSLLRLVWRLVNPAPAFAEHLKPWERAMAHIVHWGLYVFMIAMPIAGWIMVSASTRIKVFPISFWGLFDWPRFPGFEGMTAAELKPIGHLWSNIHSDWIAWLGYVLIAFHIAGALKHQFADKDNGLARMVPGFGASGRKGVG